MTDLKEVIWKRRWEDMGKRVRRSVDFMDVNHWTYLNNAIEQTEAVMCLPNKDVSYRKAFLYLNKVVLEDYVTSDDPANDIFEETYHLLKYFEMERQRSATFKEHMAVKRERIKKAKAKAETGRTL